MKSIKLTPIWMFIFLLAILIMSVVIGAQVSEGFTSRATYAETDVTGYANKVWPIVTSSIHFDKANGNIVLQTGATADKIITRRGDETGTASSVIKLDTPLAKTVDGAWTSWMVSRDKNQLFYMPWDKITFAHLVTDGVHKSGFCFDGANQTVGEYDTTAPGKRQTRGRLDEPDEGPDSVVPFPPFLKPIYMMKSSPIYYDITSGCVAFQTGAESFDIFDREGNDVNSSSLKIVAEGPTKGKIDFSLGKYTLNKDTKFSPWILDIVAGSDGIAAFGAVARAKNALAEATKANTATTKNASTAAAVTTAQADLDAKQASLAAATTKSVLIMPYGTNTLIAAFKRDAGSIKLIDVKRFNESGLVIPPPAAEPDATLPPPSADSAISEYYKWYWYWNKTGKTASDDYMLKTQIVPPVCPSCPVANCPASAVVSGSGSVSGSATPITDVVNATGSVAEKTVDTAGNILKSFGSGATSVGLGTVDLAKGAASGTVDLAKGAAGGTVDLAKGAAGGTVGLARDVVGGTVGLARDVVGGTVGLAKDTVKGTVGLAKDTIGGTVDLARGKYSADEGQRASRGGGGSYSASSHSTMDPYTYNGQLQNKPSADFMPVTANFSAFSR